MRCNRRWQEILWQIQLKILAYIPLLQSIQTMSSCLLRLELYAVSLIWVFYYLDLIIK